MWMGAVFSTFSFFHAIGKNCRNHTNSQQPLRGYGLCGPAGWRRSSHLPIITAHAKCRRDGNGGTDHKGAHAAQRCRIIPITSRSYLYCTGQSDPPAHEAGDPLRAAGGACHHGHRSGQEDHPLLQHFSALHLLNGRAEVKTGTFSDRIFLLKAHSLFSLRTLPQLPHFGQRERRGVHDDHGYVCVSLFVEVYESTKKDIYYIYIILGIKGFCIGIKYFRRW